ncbi:MAG TPA: phosphoribosylanthranilate isomerase [Candidatus Tectomicrobia bacterium]|nr:phosphoribosylanthranilate isomerase [Candidatus Tectomicrobia bacterium]
MVQVKICGITSLEDARAAIDAGADALGFVFYPPSPRYVTPEQAARVIQRLPPFVTTVGLFVDLALDTVNDMAARCGLDRVQLHGRETPEFCGQVSRPVIKAFHVESAESLAHLPAYRVSAYLLDAYVEGALPGGTGASFSWELAAQAKPYGPVILAGGLTPENVQGAIARVRPYGVDVSTGVERAPGVKDHRKLQEFIARAKTTAALVRNAP